MGQVDQGKYKHHRLDICDRDTLKTHIRIKKDKDKVKMDNKRSC